MADNVDSQPPGDWVHDGNLGTHVPPAYDATQDPAAKIDSMSEAAHSEEPAVPVPPATFEFLTFSLRMQAEMHLGLLHFGSEGEKPEPNLDMARHSIDLLAVLQEKTKGNLTLEEQRLLENSLTELRFRYVQVSSERKEQNK